MEELFGSSDDDDSDKRSARSDRSDADVNNGQSVRQSDDDEEAEGGKPSRSPSPSASGSASAASASPAPSDADAEPEAADDDVQHSDDQEGQGEEKQQQSDDERSEDEAPRDDEEASDGERSARSEEPDDVGSQSGDDRNEHSGAEIEEANADGSEPEAEVAADDGHTAQSGSESEAEVEAEGSPQQEADDGSARESGSDDEASGKRKRSDQEAEDESQSPRRESGSESDTSAKKKRRVGSDNDDDDKNAIAADLFGEADDISSDSGGEGKAKPDIDPLANLSPEPENDMDDEPEGENSPAPVPEEEEAEAVPVPEEIPETRIDVEIPKITTDLGKDLHFVKLPNFLSVETRPFDQQTYEDEIDEDEVLDEEGRARLKLKVENTIRWRWGFDKEGNPVRESNARVVKWTDGSMSLHLGSEIFDVHKQLLQGDHNHMFIRQGTGLQGQAVFRTKLTFRPHSTDSFTHRKITMSVADRSQKTQKIRILPNVGQDPEAHRSEMIKKEEDRLKASIRRENKQRRIRDRALSRGLTSAYLEPDRYDDDEEDDDGAISLAAIKNKYKKGVREVRPSIYSSESDASDIDDRGARRLERAKALADSDEERGAKDSDEQPSGSEGPKKRIARIEDSDED